MVAVKSQDPAERRASDCVKYNVPPLHNYADPRFEKAGKQVIGKVGGLVRL